MDVNDSSTVQRVAFGTLFPSCVPKKGPVGARVCGQSPVGRSTPEASRTHLPAVLRNEHHVELAVLTYMCQTLGILHTLCLLPNRASPESERMLFRGTPERLSPQGRTAVGRGFIR